MLLPGQFILIDNSSIALNPQKWKIKIINKKKIFDNINFKYLNTPKHMTKIKLSLSLFNNGILDLTDNFYRCLHNNNIDRTLIYSLSCLNVFKKKEAIKLLNSYKFYDLYPIILGETTKKKLFLKLIDCTKSLFLNYKENLKINLNYSEKYIYKITQNSINTKEIIYRLSKYNNLDFKSCEQIAVNFYKKLLKSNSILFYNK